LPIFDNLQAFQARLPVRGSLLALDLSKRRIGLAGTDVGRLIVTPLHTIPRSGLQRDIERLAGLIRQREAVGLVLGWPLTLHGEVGAACQSVLGSARHLDRAIQLPLLLQDERLTTSAVKFAIEEGKWLRPRAREPIDHLAAAVILEDALRALGALPARPESG
jgi:putative Holliday junction resolvase